MKDNSLQEMKQLCSNCRNEKDCSYNDYNHTRRCCFISLKYNRDFSMCGNCCRLPVCKKLKKYWESKIKT